MCAKESRSVCVCNAVIVMANSNKWCRCFSFSTFMSLNISIWCMTLSLTNRLVCVIARVEELASSVAACTHAFSYLWHSWQRRPSSVWLNPGPLSSRSPWALWWRCYHISGPCGWWEGLWCAGSEGLWGSVCTRNAEPWFSSPWNASGSCRKKISHIREHVTQWKQVTA